jgi:hypothetical protein
MQEQINNIEKKVDKLYDSIIGSDLQPNGINPRLQKVEEYQSKDKKQKWMVAGAALLLGTIAKFWKDLF